MTNNIRPECVVNYDSNNHAEIINFINNSIEKFHFCVVKGYHDYDTQFKILKILEEKYGQSKEIRVSGGFYFNMPDYRRLDIGDSYSNSRFSRYMLFCEWNKENEELFNLIKGLISFRNELAEIQSENYSYNIKDNKINHETLFCDVIRMIQYPIGGGFLSCHNDADNLFYPDKMLNMLLPITTRRKEHLKNNNELTTFDKGGLYYIHKGEKIDAEEFVQSGDIIFHDTKIEHGINCIDNDKSLDLKNLCGRITLNFSIGLFSK
jgi:hypothetical protein